MSTIRTNSLNNLGGTRVVPIDDIMMSTEPVDADTLDGIEGSYIAYAKGLITDEDWNLATEPAMHRVNASAGSYPLNNSPYDGAQGTLFVSSGEATVSTTAFQLFVSDTGKTYRRSLWSTWTDWGQMGTMTWDGTILDITL